MQFLVYDPHYNPDSPEAAAPPSPELMAEMGKFIGEAMQAGVLVSTGALQRKGTRLRLAGGKFTVTDGPFIKAKEVIGGYWMIDVKSKEEAVEWAKQVPAQEGDMIEIRQVFEMSDFPPEVQKAADSPRVKAQVEKRK